QKQKRFVYANEADILNVALFGITARQWRVRNKDKQGNMRDHAQISQLICLSNLESINAQLVDEGFSQSHRLEKLNKVAIKQMKSLTKHTESLTNLATKK